MKAIVAGLIGSCVAMFLIGFLVLCYNSFESHPTDDDYRLTEERHYYLITNIERVEGASGLYIDHEDPITHAKGRAYLPNTKHSPLRVVKGLWGYPFADVKVYKNKLGEQRLESRLTVLPDTPMPD